jgi:dihydrofolate reductase
MGTVVLDMAMSLDGYVSGQNGVDGGLHDWYFDPKGGATGLINEQIAGIGAMILGRRVFGDDPAGWDTPYKVPHFVLTHTARPAVQRDGMAFHFVSGAASAFAQAQQAAGGKIVCVAGGAQTARQFLKAGLIDEIHLHMIAKIMGGGLRLFDTVDQTLLEPLGMLETPGVTHLRYRVIRA